MDVPVKFGLGFALSGAGTLLENLPESKVGSWGGWGGSQVIVDVENGVTIAYVMNKMENAGLGQDKATGEKRGMGNPRTNAYVNAIYKALGVN